MFRMLVSIELPDVLELSDWSEALNSTTNRTLWLPKNSIASNQVKIHNRDLNIRLPTLVRCKFYNKNILVLC